MELNEIGNSPEKIVMAKKKEAGESKKLSRKLKRKEKVSQKEKFPYILLRKVTRINPPIQTEITEHGIRKGLYGINRIKLLST